MGSAWLSASCYATVCIVAGIANSAGRECDVIGETCSSDGEWTCAEAKSSRDDGSAHQYSRYSCTDRCPPVPHWLAVEPISNSVGGPAVVVSWRVNNTDNLAEYLKGFMLHLSGPRRYSRLVEVGRFTDSPQHDPQAAGRTEVTFHFCQINVTMGNWIVRVTRLPWNISDVNNSIKTSIEIDDDSLSPHEKGPAPIAMTAQLTAPARRSISSDLVITETASQTDTATDTEVRTKASDSLTTADTILTEPLPAGWSMSRDKLSWGIISGVIIGILVLALGVTAAVISKQREKISTRPIHPTPSLVPPVNKHADSTIEPAQMPDQPTHIRALPTQSTTGLAQSTTGPAHTTPEPAHTTPEPAHTTPEPAHITFASAGRNGVGQPISRQPSLSFSSLELQRDGVTESTPCVSYEETNNFSQSQSSFQRLPSFLPAGYLASYGQDSQPCGQVCGHMYNQPLQHTGQPTHTISQGICTNCYLHSRLGYGDSMYPRSGGIPPEPLTGLHHPVPEPPDRVHYPVCHEPDPWGCRFIPTDRLSDINSDGCSELVAAINESAQKYDNLR